MDDSLRVVCEMNEMIWGSFKSALEDLREWHLDSLQHGAPMPTIAASVDQRRIDAVPLDFEANFAILENLHTRFVDTLRTTTLTADDPKPVSQDSRRAGPLRSGQSDVPRIAGVIRDRGNREQRMFDEGGVRTP